MKSNFKINTGFAFYAHKSKTTSTLLKDEAIKAIACGANHSMLLKDDGNVFVFEANNSDQFGFGDLEIDGLLHVSWKMNSEILASQGSSFFPKLREHFHKANSPKGVSFVKLECVQSINLNQFARSFSDTRSSRKIVEFTTISSNSSQAIQLVPSQIPSQFSSTFFLYRLTFLN